MNINEDKRPAEILASIDKMMIDGNLSKKSKETIKGWCSEYGVLKSFSGDRCYWEAVEEIADRLIKGGAGVPEASNVTADGYVLIEQFRDYTGRAWRFGHVSGMSASVLPETVVEMYFRKQEG
jgi:hypothetical protein